MKKISVIIPCFNAAKWLPQCFLSLVQQTIGINNLELIFVNDASTDQGQTWGLLLEFERAYPDSVIIIDLAENRRQGGARNEALSYTSGEYLSYVDADDWVELDIYEKVYRKAKETDADVVQFNHSFYSKRTGVFENPQKMEDETLCIKSEDERKVLLLSEKITYGCWNKLYRSSLVKQAGVKFAEHVIYEEPLFVYPLLYYGQKYTIMHENLYVYRQNEFGTMHKDMMEVNTILEHAKVQLDVWNFMKRTCFFRTFYEEIKLYFLHTYFYETLYFAKSRGLSISMKQYKQIEKTVLEQVPDLVYSVYESVIPQQMKLYQLVQNGMTEEKLAQYIESIPVGGNFQEP